MSEHMLLEVRRPGESLATDVTLEWLLSRVDAHMSFDRRRLRECLTTNITLQWFTSRVVECIKSIVLWK